METMILPPRTGMEAFKLMPEGTFCQLINDDLVMSPAPFTNHAQVQGEIFSALSTFLKTNNVGSVFFAPVDVYLNSKNVFQPDILFISNERIDILKKEGVYGAPDLVIEILSKGTRKNDLGRKKNIYEQEGVKEYWVVDPETKWCEGFVLTEKQFKSTGEFSGSFTIQMFDLQISI